MRHPKDLVVSVALISATAIAISALWRDNLVTSVLLTGILVLTLGFWHTRKDMTHLFIAALVGPAMEAVCVYSGAWSYSNPNLLVPVWLPLCWGLAGIILPRLAGCFEVGGLA